MAKQAYKSTPNPEVTANTKIVPDRIKEELDLGIQYYQMGNLSAAELCFQQVL